MACKNGQNPDQKSGKTEVLNPFTQSRRIQNRTMALFHTLFWVGAHDYDQNRKGIPPPYEFWKNETKNYFAE